jgi:hypothetical protein
MVEPDYPDMCLFDFRASVHAARRKDGLGMVYRAISGEHYLDPTTLGLTVIVLEHVLPPEHELRSGFLPRLRAWDEKVAYMELRSSGEFAKEVKQMRVECAGMLAKYLSDRGSI